MESYNQGLALYFSMLGSTENILKAQEIAVAAVAHPDSVYGEVDAT